VRAHYNHRFYLIKESGHDDGGAESTMNHTQHNR
jgi:hypothetical protein